MKKDRKSHNILNDLYLYMDMKSNMIDEECYAIKEKKYNEIKDYYDNIFKNKYGYPYEWMEYYGLFKSRDNHYCIDPKRMYKKSLLSKDIYSKINCRNTTYFHPRYKQYYDYKVNIIVGKIKEIKDNFKNTYKPIIDKSVEEIKNMKQLCAGDYLNLQMGISSVGAASTWANYQNWINESNTNYKKIELFNSLYAQFFLSMVSQVEAATITIYCKASNKTFERWSRKLLYGNMNINGIDNEKLPSFKYHDKMYLIWNFIKHNNGKAYKDLKERYPEVLIDNEYKSGDIAMHYLILNEKLIIELLDGVTNYFKEWCFANCNEDYEEAQWNYEEYFISAVNNEIENIINPEGFTWLDEID